MLCHVYGHYLLQQLGVPAAVLCAVLSGTEGHIEGHTLVNVGFFARFELNIVVAASVVESVCVLGCGCWLLSSQLFAGPCLRVSASCLQLGLCLLVCKVLRKQRIACCACQAVVCSHQAS